MKKNMIMTKDYDFYSFKLPLDSFIGRKRNIFINSQLDKIHPCFSVSSCFDVKTYLSKKGLFIHVIVMNKLKLIEYKSKFGENLWIKENKYIKIFQNRKKQLCQFVSFFVIAFIFSFVLHRIQSKNEMNKHENITFESSLRSSLRENDSYDYVNLFKTISENKGKIEQIQMERIQESIVTKIKLKEILPELIGEKAKLSPVIYHDGKASFSIEIMEKMINEKKSFSQINVVMPKIRKEIQSNDGFVSEENFNTGRIKFVLKNNDKQNFGLFINKLNELFSSSGCGIKSFVFTVSDENSIQFDVCLSENESIEYKDLFNIIGECENLFLYNEIPKNKTQKITKNISVAEKSFSEEKMENIIGRIYKENGQCKIFYRDVDGKIKFIVKKET
ncbi:MAG: hypothetical protein GX677_04745 [Treponema sp.]|nr:hypothetical protein [Treponema sp.]